MDLNTILDSLAGAVPLAKTGLMGLGSLVVIATVLVKLTPSQEDDAVLNRLKEVPLLGSLLLALERFSVISRK